MLMYTYHTMPLFLERRQAYHSHHTLIHTHSQSATHIRIIVGTLFKGRVHCFSMQAVMNKCFLLNLEKKLAQIRLVVFEKHVKNAPLIPKNDVTEPKARLL